MFNRYIALLAAILNSILLLKSASLFINGKLEVEVEKMKTVLAASERSVMEKLRKNELAASRRDEALQASVDGLEAAFKLRVDRIAAVEADVKDLKTSTESNVDSWRRLEQSAKDKDRILAQHMKRLKTGLAGVTKEFGFFSAETGNLTTELDARTTKLRDDLTRMSKMSERREAQLEDELKTGFGKVEKINESVEQVNRIINSYREELKHLVKSDSKITSQIRRLDDKFQEFKEDDQQV